MSTPDWKDAPEWAEWVAMDDDGTWTWFECEPRLGAVRGLWYPTMGKFESVNQSRGPICLPRPTNDEEPTP